MNACPLMDVVIKYRAMAYINYNAAHEVIVHPSARGGIEEDWMQASLSPQFGRMSKHEQ